MDTARHPWLPYVYQGVCCPVVAGEGSLGMADDGCEHRVPRSGCGDAIGHGALSGVCLRANLLAAVMAISMQGVDEPNRPTISLAQVLHQRGVVQGRLAISERTRRTGFHWRRALSRKRHTLSLSHTCTHDPIRSQSPAYRSTFTPQPQQPAGCSIRESGRHESPRGYRVQILPTSPAKL